MIRGTRQTSLFVQYHTALEAAGRDSDYYECECDSQLVGGLLSYQLWNGLSFRLSYPVTI